MSPGEDVGIEIAREAAGEGLARFQATRDRYERSPNPDPRAGPTGGVALPGMGRGGGPPPGRPRAAPRRPPRPGTQGNGAARQEAERLRREAEAIALRAMLEARADFIPNLFKDAEVRYKKGKSPRRDALAAAKDVAKKGKKTAESARKAEKSGGRWTGGSAPAKQVDAEGMKEAGRLGREIFRTLGELDPAEFAALEGIVTELVGDIFTELGTTLVPIVGTLKTGAKAGSKWAKAGATQHKVAKTQKARGKVIQGDPERAVASVKRLLERERNVLATEAGVATAKLGTDVAGYFVDLGIMTSVGSSAVEAGARLAIQIRLIVRDARERRAANELLTGPRLDAELFERCPLLGAYAVAGSNTSDLVGFLGGDPQRHGFTLDDLEKIIKTHQRPLVKNATELIARSRLEVAGMSSDLASARARARAAKKSFVSRIANDVGTKLRMKAGRG